VADEPNGPRGDTTRSKLLAQDLSNLMLLCDAHHRLIDKVDISGHPEPYLISMKKAHEARIELVTGIAPDMQSHIVLYKANVGAHTPVLNYQIASEYLIPDHYPAMSSAIDLSLSNSAQKDASPSYWKTELENLETQFNEQLRPKFRKGEIKHLSVFAFAPMPLLMKLGVLINDIHSAEIHQPIRNPKSWNLDDTLTPNVFKVLEPTHQHQTVALNISISGTIANDRITRVLGNDTSIYTLAIDVPANDFLQSKQQLKDFSAVTRNLFDRIKARFGGNIPLHIFPAMPVAMALELGRVWMPKADMSIAIYDENTVNSGFFKAIDIANNP
jgi:hypothetical protein